MLKIAVIGTGNISQSHIDGLLAFEDKCKIVALVDIKPEVAKKKQEKFKLGDVQIFESHQDLIKSDLKIDIAHVCTPPYTHASIAIDCMDAGMNVLVEKPMGTCVKECDEMLEAEKRNNVTLAAVAQNRFRDIINKLKIVADSGIAGKIRCAHVNSFWWRGHSYYDLWWRGTWEKEGGGPTLNHAVHHIDMINWIQNEMPQEVTGVLTNVMHDNSEVEDLSFATLKYKDGAIAQVTSSVVHHGEEQGIELQCADAKISAPFSVAAELSRDNGFPTPNKELVDKITQKYNSIPSFKHEGHAGQIGDLLDAIKEGRRPAITGIDGKNTIELITAIYKSGFLKRTVELPIKPDDEFYTFDGILKNATYFYKKGESKDSLGDEAITVGRY
ncbi:MAG: Gfo/Idh/MocA family oxidoreductase [Defluviitaleaceae bacterium]|nr:Gfo/Idh/MocA family oxidoreductase [Defluviitaleaceae bacterium]